MTPLDTETRIADPIRTSPLSVAGRRRLLTEFAHLYNAEQGRDDQPITDSLAQLVPQFCAFWLTDHGALALFKVFARERSVLARAEVDEQRLNDAELRCEELLDRLVGERA